jgi:hypothetical protein
LACRHGSFAGYIDQSADWGTGVQSRTAGQSVNFYRDRRIIIGSRPMLVEIRRTMTAWIRA